MTKATKIPKWMYDAPKHVCHPTSTLREAARVIRAELRICGASRQERAVAMFYVRALESVANGETWAKALGLPEQQP